MAALPPSAASERAPGAKHVALCLVPILAEDLALRVPGLSSPTPPRSSRSNLHISSSLVTTCSVRRRVSNGQIGKYWAQRPPPPAEVPFLHAVVSHDPRSSVQAGSGMHWHAAPPRFAKGHKLHKSRPQQIPPSIHGLEESGPRSSSS